MELNKFKTLIDNFNKLPKSDKILPTYLELSGQPHFENVCSNILAFYFNTNESHGLKDLVLKSFIECIDENILIENDIETISIERELGVDDKKRIDIIVECSDFVIVIENKIYHELINDLFIYEKSIKNIYPNKKHIFIVLSLKEEKPNNEKFSPITYEQFFNKLKNNIGSYFVNSNNQYSIFLIDFIKTIENLKQKQIMNKEYFNFFIENKSTIEDLIIENNNLKSNLYSKVNSLYSLLPTNEEIRNCKKRSIYLKHVIFYDFDINESTVALDIVIDLTKIQILLFTRSVKNGIGKYELLNELEVIKKYPNLKKNQNGRYILYEEDIIFTEFNNEVLADRIKDFISLIY